MDKINMAQAIVKALEAEMLADKKVLVLGQDVGINGGVFRVTDGLFEQFGNERVIDTPLAESGIVGTSVGLSIYGYKPVAEIQFSGFMYPGFNQLVTAAARLRNRTRGEFTIPLVIRMPYGGGIRALEHHSESMEALYAHIPGLKVVIPSSPNQAYGLLRAAIQDPDPVIFMEPKRIYRAIKEELTEEKIEIGKAKITKEGDECTVIAYGAMHWVAHKAIAQLGYKYHIELIDLRTISPLDIDTIIKSVQKTGRCVIVHEGPKSFGVAAEIIASINEKALYELQAPVERVTGYDTIMPYYQNEANYIPDEEKIIASIERVMKT